jgi:cytochrome c-type biogenesis protein CcmH/NrfG
MEEQIQGSSSFNFGKIFGRCLFGLILLLPIIFIPVASVSLYAAKITLLAVAIVVFIGAFLAQTLSSGLISLPKTKMLIPIALFPIVALVSSFFSGQMVKSVAGEMFEMGTSGSFLVLTLLFFLAMFAFRSRAEIGVKAVYYFFLGAAIVVLHLLVRALPASFLPEAIASRVPNFLLGGSIDTAIFLGGVVIAALSSINMFSLNDKARYALYAFLVLGMAFIGAAGFMPVIIVLGLFALVYFVYTFSWSVGQGDHAYRSDNKASFPALFVLAISVVFILSGNALSGYLANVFNVNMIEVRPNFTTTTSLVLEAWKQNPVLGVGPNMFKELWDLKRPNDINVTQFWATDFSFGSAFMPTLAATAGPLGILALLAFLVLYVRFGFKSIFASNEDPRFRYISSTTFFVSLFLWLMTFVYVPSVILLSLTFIFTGIFVATLVPQGVVTEFTVNIFRNPKANFASVFVIIVLLISSIAFGYFIIERVVASTIFQKGDVARAIQIAPTDTYWRGLSEISLTQVGNIISSISSVENLSESDRVNIQTAVGNAIESSRQAIAWNSENYQNWFALGRVYEVLAANGIAGSAENATAAYLEAQKRSPQSPAIPLALARLKALSGDLQGAREEIGKAIQLKNNYTDAYFTLAQLEAAANNVQGAINSVEAATLIDPNNAVLYFQLGLLKYNNHDSSGAAKAFERAVELVPDYANARYFLGLSYDRLNRESDAIAQFEAIQKTNPGNQEVELILRNLKAGRSPFNDAKPPIDDKPEKRAEPPIEE